MRKVLFALLALTFISQTYSPCKSKDETLVVCDRPGKHKAILVHEPFFGAMPYRRLLPHLDEYGRAVLQV